MGEGSREEIRNFGKARREGAPSPVIRKELQGGLEARRPRRAISSQLQGPGGFCLGQWQNQMRYFPRIKRLSPKRIKALDEVGFLWQSPARHARFQRGLDETLRYKMIHHCANTPYSLSDPGRIPSRSMAAIDQASIPGQQSEPGTSQEPQEGEIQFRLPALD